MALNFASKKRKCLSFREKYDIIDELQRGEKNATVCKKYNLPSSTVSTLWKNKDVIISAFENSNTALKKIRKCELNDVDQALFEWYMLNKEAGYPISRPILRSQANTIAKQLGHETFSCSNGWLDRFRIRHNIVFPKNRHSNSSTNAETSNPPSEWLKLEMIHCEVDIKPLIEGPSYSQAQESLEILIDYFENNDTPDNVFNALNIIRENLNSKDIDVKIDN